MFLLWSEWPYLFSHSVLFRNLQWYLKTVFLFLLNFPSNNKTASRTHTQQHRLGMSHLALPNLFLLLPKWAVAENLVGQTIILKSSKRPKKMGHITYSAYYIRKYAHVCLYVMRPGWKQNLIEIWSEVAAAEAHKWGGFAQKLALSTFSFCVVCSFCIFFCLTSTFDSCFLFCFVFGFSRCMISTHPTLLASYLANLEYNELSQWLWCKKLPLCLLSCLCIVSMSTMENVLKFRPGKNNRKRKT